MQGDATILIVQSNEGTAFGRGTKGGIGGEGTGGVCFDGVVLPHRCVVLGGVIGDQGVFSPFGGEEQQVSLY